MASTKRSGSGTQTQGAGGGSQCPFGIFDHATIDPVCSKAVKPDPRSHEVRQTQLGADRPTVASTRLAVLNLLLGRHDKAHEVGDAEGCRHRDVRGVAAAPHDDAADAGMVVTRVFRVPAPG